jgi:hypothetical protein
MDFKVGSLVQVQGPISGIWYLGKIVNMNMSGRVSVEVYGFKDSLPFSGPPFTLSAWGAGLRPLNPITYLKRRHGL